MEATDEDRAEAARLALLPKALQREAVEMIRSPADDPDVSAEDRAEATRRANALRALLRLNPKGAR